MFLLPPNFLIFPKAIGKDKLNRSFKIDFWARFKLKIDRLKKNWHHYMYYFLKYKAAIYTTRIGTNFQSEFLETKIVTSLKHLVHFL